MVSTRVFQNGNSQAIRIPQELRTEKKEYLIQKIGDTFIALDGRFLYIEKACDQQDQKDEYDPSDHQRPFALRSAAFLDIGFYDLSHILPPLTLTRPPRRCDGKR